MSVVYAVVKDPFVRHKTVSVLKPTKDNEATCNICSQQIYHESLNLFARKLIGLCCSFDCLKKYDGGYLDKKVDVVNVVKEVDEEIENEEPTSQRVIVDDPVKKVKKTTVGTKKTCPKCGGAAKRGRGAGRFHHDAKCPEYK